MNDVQVRLASEKEVERWDELIQTFANHRIFHTRAWLRSLETYTGLRAIYLIFEDGGAVVGCLPGFIRRIGFLPVFCSPQEGWQTETLGPVFDPGRVTTERLVGALVSFLEREMGVVHIEMVTKDLDHQSMARLGFHGVRLFSYRAPLYPGEPDFGFSKLKANARNHCRKAQKSGLEVRIEKGAVFLDECFDQMQEVFRRRGNAMPFGKDRIRHLLDHLLVTGSVLPLSVVTASGDSAATGIFLVHGRELILWSWTHRTAFRDSSPTELLTWTAMEAAARRGCDTFDMTGGGETKRKYGGVPDETSYRWIRSRYEWMLQAREWARVTYRWQQRVRGKIARRLSAPAEVPVGDS